MSSKRTKGHTTQPSAGLRRVDWRFLLPSPDGVFERMVILGGPDGLEREILENGIAHQVSATLDDLENFNAIAVLANARVDLAQAARCLVPGGSLYYEVDRRSPWRAAFTPDRLQRQMRRAGLAPTGVYWAAPDFANCKRYIPLDHPRAFDWYLSTLYVAGSPQHRLLELLVRLYLSVPHQRFALLAHCYAVTATAVGPAPIPPPSVLAQPGLPEVLQSPGLKPVLLTSGQDDGSRAVLLPFAPGSDQPEAVIKIATRPDFNINIEREQAALENVRAVLAPDKLHTVPRPLGSFRFGSLSVGVETCAAGQPLYVSSGRWPGSFHKRNEDLTLAANWLCEFHHKMRSDHHPWDEAAHQRWIEAPFKEYEEIFGLTAKERQLFQAARKRSLAMAGANLPIVWMHYDFIPWNIYRVPCDLTVIDWETGGNWERERFGPALYDLLFFVTYWIHLVGGIRDERGELRALRKLFLRADRRDRYTRAVHQAIAHYMRSLNIDRRFLPLILVYLWVEQALHKYHRKRLLGKVETNARSGNRGIAHIGVLAEAAETLFASDFHLLPNR